MELFSKRYDQSIIPKLNTTGIRYFEVFGDFDGNYLAAKSTQIITNKASSVRDIKIIQPILNSSVVAYFMKEAYGGIAIVGGITFSPDNLSKIPIPLLTMKQGKLLINLSNKYTNHFVEENQNELEHLVYSIYELSESNIKTIK